MAGEYDALSYVWGFPELRETINVNGEDVPATMNLESALRRVRNAEKADLLWVDAICINQKDIEERNAQVMRMKEIYNKSRKVMVWLSDCLMDRKLGEEEDDEDWQEQWVQESEDAISLLSTIHAMARTGRMRGKPNPYLMMVEDPPPFEDPKTKGLPGLPDAEWGNLRSFLNSPWFGRVWIIQEVAASKDATLMIGKTASIQWTHLAIAAIWLLSQNYADHIWGLETLWNILLIDTCRSAPREPLLRRLNPTSTFHSTMPHDKIYALLGMTLEGRQLERFPRLRVDYGRDWRELFRDVVRHCMETPGSFSKKPSLHVLSQVRHEPNDDGEFMWDAEQSSWVPSWNDDNMNCPLSWRKYALGFKTSRDILPQGLDVGDSRVLSLKGVGVDRVSKTYPYLLDVRDDGPFFSLSHFDAVAKLWGAVSLNLKLLYYNRYPHLGDAFASVITGGGWVHQDDSLASGGMYFAMYWELGLLFAEEKKFHLSYLNAPLQKDARVWDHMEGLEEEEMSARKMNMGAKFENGLEVNKVVFVTEKGYLGIGPPITKPGDEVCVLYGGLSPFAVRKVKKGVNCPDWLDVDDEDEGPLSVDRLKASMRNLLPFRKKTPKNGQPGNVPPVADRAPGLPTKGYYRFVGECYVDGLMEGQAIDRRDAGELQDKAVHLV
ncbi:HET-domain-containing protein [Corynespora cassiicola Philippines]|uniref:HET-domain-containing protein n=1 Tax=Corynespora cassiicola Philippines TaxID=1448308 RepID=A0A2T2NPJ0_CORCC|nr:HET-domain-containing protein [Corynespora cassiicola Philippines]